MRIHIDSALCDVTIEGPDQRQIWRSSDPVTYPRLAVRATGSNVLHSLSAGELTVAESAAQISSPGVFLSEETAYRLSVVTHSGKDVRLRHQDKALIADVRPVRGRPDVVTGLINFRSQVGESRLEVLGQDGSLVIEIEVRPTKLDYDIDYADLTNAVGELSRKLVLEYLRPTEVRRGLERGKASRVEWLVLLREEIDRLKRALAFVVAHPRSQLVREVRMSPAHRIRRSSSVTRRAVARGQGEGPWSTSPIAPRHRSLLPTQTAQETLRTDEHRWLRQELRRATTALAEVRSSLRGTRGGALSRRTAAISASLAEMQAELAKFETLEPFASSRRPISGSFTSLTLLAQPGYREAYQSLLRLRMSTTANGDALRIPVKSLAELYEVWCYLAAVSIASDVLGVAIDAKQLFVIEDRGINLRVVPGRRSEVVLQVEDGRISIAYNREFRMLTGRQRPDIVLEVNRSGVPPMVLLLDAKYRLDTSSEYIEAFDGPGPPIDAIGQMHRYRDAIVMSHSAAGLGRPVVRAAALFPLGTADAANWPEHRLYRSIGEVGIGGLPFLPSNTAFVREWLEQSLKAPTSALAWPGPDFLAWSSLRSG